MGLNWVSWTGRGTLRTQSAYIQTGMGTIRVCCWGNTAPCKSHWPWRETDVLPSCSNSSAQPPSEDSLCFSWPGPYLQMEGTLQMVDVKLHWHHGIWGLQWAQDESGKADIEV